MDRDENAALNIVKRGVKFTPVGLAGEAVKGNENASNETTLLLRVDTSKLTQRG